jgi:hypothetical protein
MPTSQFVKISIAAVLLLGTAAFGASTIVKAQTQPQEQVDPNQLRAAQEPEEEFSDDQRAMQADAEDNDPANANRLMIMDANGRPYMYDGIRDGFTCRARRVAVRRTYRRMTRCGFGQDTMNNFISRPSAFINSGAFINPQIGGAFPQGFDPGAFRSEDSEETFTDDQRAIQADAEDNDPANENRMMVFDGSGRPLSFNSRPAGMWCRVVRVPSRAVYRRTINCNRR